MYALSWLANWDTPTVSLQPVPQTFLTVHCQYETFIAVSAGNAEFKILSPLLEELRLVYRTISDSIPFRRASVAQLDAPSNWRPGGRGFNPRWGRQHSFVEIDREIFSTVIRSLPLIQEGQLSVSGERMCTILVNRLED